ncbi:hypothetical protein [Zavarzinella formosa]|uniref:hypothetical protein n=1 Tax=Zavarzinella formosa TaxID=360055 RepID=UPI0002EAF77F|nr:hypothetical protein [Zavarzinella formosa]
MPTFQINDQWTGRNASASLDSPRSLNRTFEVLTDTQGMHGSTIIDAVIAEFPDAALGSPHPDWPAAICRSIGADPTDNPLMWEVAAAYAESKQQQNGAGTGSGPAAGTGGDGGAQGQDPSGELTYQPPKFSFRPVETIRPHDVNGKPYLNTAGVPLENPPPNYDVNGTITAPRRYPIANDTDVAWFMAAIGKVNSLAWGGFLAGELRIAGADFEPKGGWWEGSWLLEVKRELWIPTKVMSAGRTFLNVKVGPLDTFVKGRLDYKKDSIGQAITDMMFLDDQGQEADITKIVGTNATIVDHAIVKGGPALVEFQQSLTVNFAAIMGAHLY